MQLISGIPFLIISYKFRVVAISINNASLTKSGCCVQRTDRKAEILYIAFVCAFSCFMNF